MDIADKSLRAAQHPHAGDSAGKAKPARRWRILLSYPVWAAAAVAYGLFVRVERWSNWGSLNSDELWIAVNLERRSFLGLRGALDYDQLAPLGWLWLEKSILAFGRSDALLRAPALVAGCSVLVLTAVLARRLLPAPLALAAVVLAAGGPVLIYQSSQVKQYSFEAAVCLLLVILALRVLDAPDRRRRAALFWLSGAVAVWFATTAIFVVAFVGALLPLFAALDRRWQLVRRHVLAAVPTLACLLAVYLLSPRPADWLYDWWPNTYPASLAPESLGFRTGLVWTAKVFAHFTMSALYVKSKTITVFVLLLMAAGALTLLGRTPRRAAIVIAPLCAGYLLALLRLYPMATRVALWLVPLALILVCAGAYGIVQVIRKLMSYPAALFRARRVAGWRLANTAGVAFPTAAAITLVATFQPWLGTTPRSTNADRYAVAEKALHFIAANRRPDDRVFVHVSNSTSALALWYGPATGLRPDGEYTSNNERDCRDNKRAFNPTGVSRVWLLRVTWERRSKVAKYRERTAMAPYGRLVAEHWYGGILVLEYEISHQGKAPASAPCLISLPVPDK